MKTLSKKQFQALPLGKKAKYLFGRYIWDLVLGLFLLTAIGNLIYEDYVAVPPVMRVDMINVRQDSTDGEAFDAFLETVGYEPENEDVRIDKRLQFGDGEKTLKCMPEQMVACKSMVGKTDLYFWDSPDMEEALAQSSLMDLRRVLPPEYLLENEDKLIYTAPLLEGGYPCGIALLDNDWVHENNYYGDCAVGISRHARDPELMGQFLEYIG